MSMFILAAMANIPQFPKFLRRPDWLLALALTAVALWMHIYLLLHAGGFWRDEVNLINLSNTHSFAEMEKDSFPILMPLLVSLWSTPVPAGNDFGIRILGTLIGLGIPAVLWLAAWRFRRSPPVLGLALLALNFTLIMYGDSLRAYGLGTLMIVLAAFAAGLFLKKPTWRQTVILAVLATLSVQALYQNAAFVAAICFGAWAVCLRGKNWSAAAKILVVAIVSAASLLPYFKQISTLPNAAVSLRSGFDPMLVCINLDKALGLPLEQYIWIWAFFALVTVVCAIGVFFCRWKKIPVESLPVTQRTALAVALASAFGVSWFIVSPETRWYFLPAIALVIVYLDSGRWLKFFQSIAAADGEPQPGLDNFSLFGGVTLLTALAAFGGFLWYAAMPTEPWYFLPLMALGAVCFEMAIPRAPHNRAGIFGFAFTIALGAVYFAGSNLDQRFTNLDLVARQVSAQAAPDDLVIVSPWYCGITFGRYYQGPAPWDTLPPMKDHSSHRYDLVLQAMKTPDAMQPVLEKISATLQAGHRVWIVAEIEPPKPGDPVPDNPLPPPLKHSGWSDRPYDIVWEKQVTQYLGNHCTSFKMVYATTNLNVNASECLKLAVADGWQNSTKGVTTGH